MRGGWWPVPEADSEAVVKALLNRDRRRILELLDAGPLRQHELSEVARKKMGRRCSDGTLLYHLGLLNRAGLIGFKTDRESRARVKLVYRAADFDVRSKGKGFKIFLRPRAKPRFVL